MFMCVFVDLIPFSSRKRNIFKVDSVEGYMFIFKISSMQPCYTILCGSVTKSYLTL